MCSCEFVCVQTVPRCSLMSFNLGQCDRDAALLSLSLARARALSLLSLSPFLRRFDDIQLKPLVPAVLDVVHFPGTWSGYFCSLRMPSLTKEPQLDTTRTHGIFVVINDPGHHLPELL